jgi:hypothetical protein
MSKALRMQISNPCSISTRTMRKVDSFMFCTPPTPAYLSLIPVPPSGPRRCLSKNRGDKSRRQAKHMEPTYPLERAARAAHGEVTPLCFPKCQDLFLRLPGSRGAKTEGRGKLPRPSLTILGGGCWLAAWTVVET